MKWLLPVFVFINISFVHIKHPVSAAVSEKDIFGHPRQPVSCRLQKIIYTAPEKHEESYTYDAQGKMTSVTSNEGGQKQTGTFNYNADGMLTSVSGYINVFDMKFYYGADKRVSKVTYKFDSDTKKGLQTASISYVGDSIVQVSKEDDLNVGTTFICVYHFDKKFNLIKATGISKKNIEENISDEIVYEFQPGVFNYNLSTGDFRFFSLFICEKMYFAESFFAPCSTNMPIKESHVDMDGNQIKSDNNSFEIKVREKNSFNFPTKISMEFRSDPEHNNTSFDLVYSCK